MESFFRHLPVLVTGATGFIGAHLAERLVALGARVRCLVRRTSKVETLPGGVELAYGELTTGEGLEQAVRGVSVVFHLAGVTKALRVEDYYRGNARGTEHLVRVLPSSGLRLVQVSSLAAAGPSPDGKPLMEDVPPRPVSHYGRSKLEAERAVLSSPLAANAVIVRPPIVFGSRDTDVCELFRSIARGWLPSLGSAEAAFSVIYVADLVEGLLLAAACPRAAGRIYFLAAESPVSWRRFAEVAGGLMNRRPRILVLPWPAAWVAALLWEFAGRLRARPAIVSRDKIREARCRHWVCDATRAREELGFVARTPFEEAIGLTLDWYWREGWLRAG